MSAIPKTRTFRIGFFTSDGSKNVAESTAKTAFKKITSAANINYPSSHVIGSGPDGLKLVLIEKNNLDESIFGYISWRRDTLLPFIEDGKTGSERVIPLSTDDNVIERTYFIYYQKTDLLAMTINHVGPKVSDLAFSLYNLSAQSHVKLEAIWKQESVKELLEEGNVLRSVDLIIAAPRNFNKANYNFKTPLTNEIIDLVTNMGGSHLKLNLRGRMNKKKNSFSYLKTEVTDFVRELAENFPKGSSGLNIRKLEITEPDNRKPTSILDQQLISKKTINVINGYPNDSDIKSAIISAKIDNNPYLAQYELP